FASEDRTAPDPNTAGFEIACSTSSLGRLIRRCSTNVCQSSTDISWLLLSPSRLTASQHHDDPTTRLGTGHELEDKNATPGRAGKCDGVPRSNRDETREAWYRSGDWTPRLAFAQLQRNSLGTTRGGVGRGAYR